MDKPWFQARLKERRLTQRDVARALGREPPAVTNLLKGTRTLKASEVRTLARLLDVSAAEVMTRFGAPVHDAAPLVPVVGYVGAGQEIHDIDDLAQGGSLEPDDGGVPCPVNLDPATIVAVRVRGGSMHPLKENWLLFYTRDGEGVHPDAVGRLAVVKIKDGPKLVKELHPGRKRGTWRLESWSDKTRDDERLDWAVPVLAIVPA